MNLHFFLEANSNRLSSIFINKSFLKKIEQFAKLFYINLKNFEKKK